MVDEVQRDSDSSLIKYADKILYYKNALPGLKGLVQDLDVYQEQYSVKSSWVGPWETWRSSDDETDIFGESRRGNFNPPAGLTEVLHEYSEYDSKSKAIAVSLKEALDSLARDYCANTDTVNIGYLKDSFFIKKYNTGVGMGAHFDMYPDSDNETMLSAVVYVNDDYEGGEIIFPEYDLGIKPEAGSILFFPSTSDYIHESKEVGQGKKIMIPMFWYANG
jgi:hypothetical protein